MMAARLSQLLWMWVALGLSGCVAVPTVDLGEPLPMQIGEARQVTLEALRMDVSGYEQVLTRADLLTLPAETRQGIWIYDLDLRGVAGQQRLMDHALSSIRASDLSDPTLGPAERNMIRLLNMTPANADLRGTPLNELLSLAPQIGFAAAEVLAASLDIEVDEPFLASNALSDALVEGVISSHPNTQTRPINPSTEYPDGRAPVPEGHLPITLEDVVADMQTFSVNFGPYTDKGIFHPGFVVGDASAEILEPNFQMVVRANANALPFKGVDLSDGSVGSVTSIGKEGAALFDFSDPQWLQIEGIAPSPKVSELQFRVLESPDPITAGDSPLPAPLGNGSVWQLPLWSLERVVAMAGFRAFGERNWQEQWTIGTDPSPLFEVSIVDGWMVLVTKGDVGAPPAPLYIWDLMGLVAQRRLHDGPNPQEPDVDRIPEGQANVTFTLKDIPVGVSPAQITAAIRKNLEVDPDSLVDIAQIILDQSEGAPDFYYVRPKWSAPTAEQGDWLFFIAASDQGQWPRTYAKPGFFADEGLSQPVHTQDEVQGDVAHLKVKIVPGMRLYCEDNNGAVYQIKVLDKPSDARVSLQISRLR